MKKILILFYENQKKCKMNKKWNKNNINEKVHYKSKKKNYNILITY